MGLREEKKRLQRQAILDTAVALFRAGGFEQTRVQDVIERLRISEGTFFNYFPTKQAVLDAAAIDVLDRSLVLLHRDVADHDRAVLERLEEMVRDFARNFSGDREFAALLALHPQLGMGREKERESHLLLARLIEEGQRRGELRRDVPARQLAELFTAGVLVTITNWLMAPAGEDPADEPEEDPLDELLLRAWHVLRDGISSPRPAKRRPPAPTARSRSRRR